jgi:hypothetical protein
MVVGDGVAHAPVICRVEMISNSQEMMQTAKQCGGTRIRVFLTGRSDRGPGETHSFHRGDHGPWQAKRYKVSLAQMQHGEGNTNVTVGPATVENIVVGASVSQDSVIYHLS